MALLAAKLRSSTASKPKNNTSSFCQAVFAPPELKRTRPANGWAEDYVLPPIVVGRTLCRFAKIPSR